MNLQTVFDGTAGTSRVWIRSVICLMTYISLILGIVVVLFATATCVLSYLCPSYIAANKNPVEA